MTALRVLLLVAALAGLLAPIAEAQIWESTVVFAGADGRLQYDVDAEGNRVPDFSHAGYRGGGEDLPEMATVRTVAPVDGDDTASIQAALDAAEALTPDARGFRGSVELAAGTYEVSGTLTIEQSGVVLRGAGNGADPSANTILVRSGDNQAPIIFVGRSTAASGDILVRRVSGRAPSFITDDIVPVGASTLTLQNPERFQVGTPVVVFHPSSADWISAVDGGGTATDPEWDEGDHPIAYARTVIAKEGATVTLDAPVFYRMNRSLSQSLLYQRDASNLIQEVGVEDLRIDIETASQVSETQAKNAVVFGLVENGWASGVTALHFWHAGFSVQNSRYVTIRDCEALEPHSYVDGGRRYNFEVEVSQLVLFEGNRATNARHAYVGNGEAFDSGIVFLDNISENAFTSSEAHRQWGNGFLFDNHVEIGSSGSGTSDRRIHLGNRGSYGTSHGWACANCVAWNAEMNGALVVVEKPPTAQNYAIGVQGGVSNRGPFTQTTEPFIEGTNVPGLTPRSLYLGQVSDRMRPVATEPLAPEARLLLAPSPNPSRGSVRLAFDVQTPTRLSWVVVDALGRVLSRAPEADYASGQHAIALPAALPAGTYWVRVRTASGEDEATSFTLLR